MNKKGNLFLVALIFAVCAGLCLVSFWKEDHIFSEQENRLLAAKPSFSVETFVSGKYSSDYEAYVTDQFPGRNFFIGVKNTAEKWMGKKDSNGVYFIRGNTLIEKHAPEDVDEKRAAEQLQKLAQQAEKFSAQGHKVRIMLVPTASAVQVQKLPAFASEYDQQGYIRQLEESLFAYEDITILPVGEILSEHREEEIYYGSDHHWTTLGAFYGWQLLSRDLGYSVPGLADYRQVTVSEDFYGTLQSKVNRRVRYDSIVKFVREGKENTEVVMDIGDGTGFSHSLYFPEKLNGKDKYAYFLGGNYGEVHIKQSRSQDRDLQDISSGKMLFLIKDSYANCLVPFLMEYYDSICMIDPRYYRADYEKLLAAYPGADVLYVYDVIHFIEDYR